MIGGRELVFTRLTYLTLNESLINYNNNKDKKIDSTTHNTKILTWKTWLRKQLRWELTHKKMTLCNSM